MSVHTQPTSADTLSLKKIAVVHDWMFVRRGGEKVLENILDVFPTADVFYLFGRPQQVLRNASRHQFFGSFLANLPFIEKLYKWLLPLLPIAAESFDLTGYDVVISSSSCVAKGVVCAPHATHVSYVHSPMRYIWDQEHFYFPKRVSLLRPLELFRRISLNHMRVWDVTATARVRTLVANSRFVAKRCETYYNRNALVLHPPVELERFAGAKRKPQQTVLLFGAWVPYKRFYEAAAKLIENGIAVVAAGSGHDFDKLRRHSKANLVQFIDSPNDLQVLSLFETAGVFLHPAVEDFGITQVEALASGVCCVAPKRGGSIDILTHGETGFLYEPGNFDEMLAMVKQALLVAGNERMENNARQSAQRFSVEAFKKGLHKIVCESVRTNEASAL